ncbi:MAG: hypothetical protein KKH93_01205 [Candidatus Omnitrophica bacterium]|nr:hypothetical protein [Candidatus Omnitrophota bacterium]MBU2043753.1 hypothetical protein [Candidatus Omnitrophota bacterium]MBU2473302.1 hypothetical protein [Candidatus Omnitrophota bacterium]
MKAVKATELLLIADNKVGKLAEISREVKENGINVRAISAWAFDGKAYFRLVVSDNAKAKKILESLGTVEEKEVIIVDLPDEVGQLFNLTTKLKNNGIDIRYIYGTASQPGSSAIVILSSDTNEKALEIISG